MVQLDDGFGYFNIGFGNISNCVHFVRVMTETAVSVRLNMCISSYFFFISVIILFKNGLIDTWEVSITAITGYSNFQEEIVSCTDVKIQDVICLGAEVREEYVYMQCKWNQCLISALS